MKTYTICGLDFKLTDNMPLWKYNKLSDSFGGFLEKDGQINEDRLLEIMGNPTRLAPLLVMGLALVKKDMITKFKYLFITRKRLSRNIELEQFIDLLFDFFVLRAPLLTVIARAFKKVALAPMPLTASGKGPK